MTDQDKAPFNMAINTLERIGGILNDIHKTESDGNLSPEQKQFIMVPQVKHFFSQASPLLGRENVKLFEDRIFALKPVTNKIMNIKSGVVQNESKKLVYSQILEDELHKLLIQIQLVLQDLKFFMPPRRDLSSAVGSFE